MNLNIASRRKLQIEKMISQNCKGYIMTMFNDDNSIAEIFEIIFPKIGGFGNQAIGILDNVGYGDGTTLSKWVDEMTSTNIMQKRKIRIEKLQPFKITKIFNGCMLAETQYTGYKNKVQLYIAVCYDDIVLLL